jgi:hypothetical protein
MTTKYALNAEKLTDEKKYTFPVRSELDSKKILNSVPLGLYNEVLALRKNGIAEFLLNLDEDVAETVQAYRKILSGERSKKLTKEHTLGHYRRPVA